MAGLAITIPNGNFNTQFGSIVTELIDVDVTGINIVGNDYYIGTQYRLTCNFTPNNTNQRNVRWSITDGSDYAAIDSSTGVFTIFETANNTPVTIKATSTNNENVYNTKQIYLTYKRSSVTDRMVKSIGNLSNVDRDADYTFNNKQILVKPANSDEWTLENFDAITDDINNQFEELSTEVAINKNKISILEDKTPKTSIESGFYVSDEEGNVGLKYDDYGFDVALLSDHFKSLIRAIENLGLALGETPTTAYPGSAGKQLSIRVNELSAIIDTMNAITGEALSNINNDIDELQETTSTNSSSILVLKTKLSELTDKLKSISQDSFTITDAEGNVGLKYDDNGLDVALLTEHFKSLIKSIDGLGLALGETSTTAYAGDKGKQVADAVEIIQDNITTIENAVSNNTTNITNLNDKTLDLDSTITILELKIDELTDFIKSISDNGFTITDAEGNVGLKYDDNGLDVALLSEHLKSLIKSIDGLGLALGETSTTAYAGDKGKQNADNISLINSNLEILTAKVNDIRRKIQSISGDSFTITDSSGNIGLQYNNNGLDAALLSEHFIGLLKNISGLGIDYDVIANIDEN